MPQLTSSSHGLALGIFGAAIGLGVAGDLVLRETPWGVNAGVWALLVVAAVVVLATRTRLSPNRGAYAFLALALLFVAFVAWRASPWLAALNLVAALGTFALAVLRAPPVRTAPVARYVVEAGHLVGDVFSAALRLAIDDVKWSEVPRGRWFAAATAVARGIAVALPISVVFLTLFLAADAVFEELVADIFDVERPLVHVGVFVLWAWVGAGLLRHVLLRKYSDAEPPAAQTSTKPWLGPIETSIALGALNTLFLLFVLVQIRYLFGGDDRVQDVAGLTYAEYARRGFFELVTVAALVLPLLVAGDWIVRHGGRRHLTLFRVLSTSLVALLFVVMASALERMRLYVDAYGLTQLRLYTTACMLWLAVVFLLLLATVLRGRPRYFAFGAFVAAAVAVVTLNAMNPDAWIANVNIDRRADGAELDPLYLADLSADATPTLIRRLNELPPKARAVVAREALADTDDEADWRAWNWGRSRAREAAREHRGALELAAGGLP